MVFGVAVMAQTTGPSAASTAGGVHIERVTGKLTKIDGKALTISATVEGKTTETVVTCDDTTRFFKLTQPAAAQPPAEGAGPAMRGRGRGLRGAPAKFEDLQVGQELMAVYNADGNIARMVRITETAAPSSPASGAGAAGTTK
jgi:hypothetical protein